MSSLFKLAFPIFLFNFAYAYDCQWTAEGTGGYVSEYKGSAELYSQPPRVIATSCTNKLCSGHAYCSMDGGVPQIITLACSALESGGCPSANACADDPSGVFTGNFPQQPAQPALRSKGIEIGQ